MKVLISGASIAGNTLAYWLGRTEHEVTVIERHPTFREGGQNVDVRGAARVVLKRIGLEDRAKELNTGEAGAAFVDEQNVVWARFMTEDFGADGPTAEIEILRGDLARIIYDKAKDRVDFRFGLTIDTIDNQEDGVTVTLSDGTTETYDLLVAAEGVGSSTREKVFPGENKPYFMDITTGYFTLPKGENDSSLARWYHAPGGRSYFVRPDPYGTTRAAMTISKPPTVEFELKTVERQKAFFPDTFKDVAWESERILEGLEKADDFYFDVLRQVKMERWYKKRVVLVGDSAWCATPLSGIGTSLAMVGGYTLAGELASSDDIDTALEQFEKVMRPYVAGGQGVPKIAPRLMHPRSGWGLYIQRSILALLASPVLRSLSKWFLPRAEQVDLKDYGLSEA